MLFQTLKVRIMIDTPANLTKTYLKTAQEKVYLV